MVAEFEGAFIQARGTNVDLLFGRPALSEAQLLRLALELGALQVGGPLSPAEDACVSEAMLAEPPPETAVAEARAAIRAGHDPLGEELCRIRPAVRRRSAGTFYTPPSLVRPMVEWALGGRPQRLVDAGCGSGRFAAAAARRNPDLEIVAVDLDPVATLLTRAALATLGFGRGRVLQQDYLTLTLDRIDGLTAFVSNPPYVRHHDLTPSQKAWAARAGRELGCHVSGLSGLHVYFYLATALWARPGDVGCFVTSAEWLDVRYGAAVRDLLLNGLGGRALHMVDARATPFEAVQATAVVTCFSVGASPESIRMRLIRSPLEMGSLDQGKSLPRAAFGGTDRWTSLLRRPGNWAEEDQVVSLGSIARVHRGLVTGANSFFILTRGRARELGLLRWCRPAITAAQEILEARGDLRDTPDRKLLLDVPRDVDRSAFPDLDAYLKLGETCANGISAVAEGYICRHRRPWWYLGVQEPPPIVATYMARQAPAFATNRDGLALVNIGHGVYPLEKMGWAALDRLVSQLNTARNGFQGLGRTYQGGLEKFEPREMESLPVRWPHEG